VTIHHACECYPWSSLNYQHGGAIGTVVWWLIKRDIGQKATDISLTKRNSRFSNDYNFSLKGPRSKVTKPTTFNTSEVADESSLILSRGSTSEEVAAKGPLKKYLWKYTMKITLLFVHFVRWVQYSFYVMNSWLTWISTRIIHCFFRSAPLHHTGVDWGAWLSFMLHTLPSNPWKVRSANKNCKQGTSRS
jgi:hypothetical protein